MISFSSTWSSSFYDTTIYRIILGVEERGTPSLNVYIDSKGYATMGAGFLVRAQAQHILTTLYERFYPGTSITTASLQSKVDTIIAAVKDSSGADKKFASTADAQAALDTALRSVTGDSSKTFTFASNDEVTSTFYKIDKPFEDYINTNLTGVPKGRERVALLSLAYNNILSQSPALISDITTKNDRADAWYQIRYDSNGGETKVVGIAKRRFYESSLFGLSADLNAPTLDEANGAYRMLNAHRTDIFNYEKTWGQLPDGQRAVEKDKTKAKRTALEALTEDYAALLSDANLSVTKTATLDNQLDPAKNLLLDTLRAQLSASERELLPANSDIKATSLYIAVADAAGNVTGTTLDASAFERYYKSGSSDDVLVGNSGADTLKGGKGNDILIGLAGNDSLDGGAGRDTLVGGMNFDTYVAGHGDTIVDIDGLGQVQLGGVTLTGASNHVSEHQWQGTGGEIYIRNGDDLIVELSDQRIVLQGGYRQIAEGNAYLDISLSGELASPGTPAYTYTGSDSSLNDIWDSGRLLGGDFWQSSAVERFVMGEGDDLVEVPYEGGSDQFEGGGSDDFFFSWAYGGDNYADGGMDNDQLADGVAIKYKTVEWWVSGSYTYDLFYWSYKPGHWETRTIFSENFTRKETSLYDSGILMHVLPGTRRADVNSNDTYLGGEGNDWLWGSGGIDRLNGGTGNDVVYGGEGNDDISGEDGNDILSGDDLTLSTSGLEHGNDYIDGGAGDDQLFGNGGDDVLIGGVGDNRIWGDDALTALQYHGDDTIDAGAGKDSVYAGGGDDVVEGGDGDDLLVGEEGDDWLEGGAGDDILIGDLADAAHRPTGTYIYASATGNDRDTWLANYNTLEAWVNRYQAVASEAVGDDWLVGGEGNDTFIGGKGDDWLNGGGGSDVYVFNLGDGVDIIDDEAEGSSDVDTLKLGTGLAAAYTFLSREGDDLVLNWGGADIVVVDGFFSSGGISQIERIEYADGQVWTSDTIALKTGSSLLGTVGGETLIGGMADDQYLVNDQGDEVLELPSGGVDTVFATVSQSHALSSNVENLVLLGDTAIEARGNSLANSLTGNAANNIFYDGDGNDTVHGGAGDDLIRTNLGWEQNTYDGGSGIDTVDYSVRAYDGGRTYGGFGGVGGVWVDLAAGKAWRYRYGAQYYDGIPDNLASIENAIGSNLRDFLVGDAGANRLEGLAGDDRLMGGSGADTLLGGAGNDTYVVDGNEAVLIEHEAEGVDTVEASIGYTLGIQFENLTLTGRAAIDGTGNDLDNILRGNSARNVLAGGAGDDVFYDGDGNDEVYGGAGNDLIRTNLGWEQNTYDGGSGIDTVDYSVRNYDGGRTHGGFGGMGGVWVDLAAGKAWRYRYGAQYDDGIPDHLAAIENAIGSNLRDFLVGDAGANRLDGLAGDDQIVGGAGADSLFGGAGNDVLSGGGGADVFAFQSKETGADRITDFSALEGDQLDLTRLLQGVAIDWSSPDSAGQYLKLFQAGDDAVLMVSLKGGGLFDAADQTITLDKGWRSGGLNADLMALRDERVILA